MELRIGFSKSTKFLPIYSKLIIWWDQVRYNSEIPISHCYGRFKSCAWQRDFIYQASGHATNFMGGEAWAKKNQVVEEYILEVPDEVVVKIGQICVDREGKPYAVKQTIGIMLSGLVWLFAFGKVEIKNPLADGDREVNCLEEWARILAEATGVKIPENIDGMSIRPFRDWIASLPMVKMDSSI